MDVLKFINEYWTLFAASFGLVIWLIRLEGKTNNNEKAIERVENQVDILETKHENLDSKLVQQLSDVRESLARIEGALAIKK